MMIKVQELFEACEDIELRNARLYADFMIRLGSEDDRVAQVWESMSREEWEHYIILNFGHHLCERAGMLAEPVRGVERSTVLAVQRITQENEARARKGNYTLHDAFEMAIAFESSEGDEYFLLLVRMIRQAIDRLGEYHLERRVQRASTQVNHHVDGLIKAISRLGKSPELVRRAREQLGARVL